MFLLVEFHYETTKNNTSDLPESGRVHVIQEELGKIPNGNNWEIGMPYISSYDLVRIVQLYKPNRHYDGTNGVSRPPQVGDTGTIVYGDDSDAFQVECVNKDGLTVWLAEFHSSEIEWLYRKPVEWDQLPSEAFKITSKLKKGMTRQEVIDVLGEPDDKGVTSRKYKTPAVFKYGCVELFFEQYKNGVLLSVFMRDKTGMGIMLLD